MEEIRLGLFETASLYLNKHYHQNEDRFLNDVLPMSTIGDESLLSKQQNLKCEEKISTGKIHQTNRILFLYGQLTYLYRNYRGDTSNDVSP